MYVHLTSEILTQGENCNGQAAVLIASAELHFLMSQQCYGRATNNPAMEKFISIQFQELFSPSHPLPCFQFPATDGVSPQCRIEEEGAQSFEEKR